MALDAVSLIMVVPVKDHQREAVTVPDLPVDEVMQITGQGLVLAVDRFRVAVLDLVLVRVRPGTQGNSCSQCTVAGIDLSVQCVTVITQGRVSRAVLVVFTADSRDISGESVRPCSRTEPSRLDLHREAVVRTELRAFHRQQESHPAVGVRPV